MATKQHDDVFQLTHGGTTHGARGRQLEYIATYARKLTIAEGFCGRKSSTSIALRVKKTKVPGRVTCQGCIKGMIAQKKRKKK